MNFKQQTASLLISAISVYFLTLFKTNNLYLSTIFSLIIFIIVLIFIKKENKDFNFIKHLKGNFFNIIFIIIFFTFINSIIYIGRNEQNYDFNSNSYIFFFLSVLSLFITTAAMSTRNSIIAPDNTKYRNFQSNNFNELLFSFASVFMDEELKNKEAQIKFIKKYFKKRNYPQLVEKAQSKIELYILEHFELEGLCRRAYWFLTFREKKYLFYLLFGLCYAKNELTLEDEKRLKFIIEKLEIGRKYYNYVKNLYAPEPESNYVYSSNVSHYLNNYYLLLNLEENATIEEIKKAYRNLAKKYHPDMLVDATKDEILYAQEMFLKIQTAYEQIMKSKGLK